MKILFFGGTGAIEDPMVKLLSDMGNDIFVTSRRNIENIDNIHYNIGDHII